MAVGRVRGVHRGQVSLFTKRHPTSPTRLRGHLPQDGMPTKTQGKQIGVAEYNRNDGFSPGSMIVVRAHCSATRLLSTRPARCG
jgi:hypothetical protein